MDEIMLMEYLKSKGMGNLSEQEFIHKFKEFMYKENEHPYMSHPKEIDYWDYPEDVEVKYRRGRPMKRNQLGYYDMYVEYPEYAAHSELKYGKPHEDVEGYPTHNKKVLKDGYNEHFNDHYAKYIVSEMYHIDNGKKCVGEFFDMHKAKEIQERYRGIISSDITAADIYVAINAQYHDYCELFKTWFGGNIDSKIIESAMVFWFKDIDYNKGFKLTDYFK